MGGDTRESTAAIGRLFAAELLARGIAVTWLGVVPTPAVASLMRRQGAAAGVVISASHNPWHDNGIKLIDAQGFKWAPAAEARLEARMDALGAGDLAGGEAELAAASELVELYGASLLASLEGQSLAGLRIGLDTGNGAASAFAARLFAAAGAEVQVIHDRPDGRNINAGCGSTHPGEIARLVKERAFDLGFTFDGDADRALLADELGQVRDGDAILYLWALALDRRGLLRGERIVATSMSNLGLEVALAAPGHWRRALRRRRPRGGRGARTGEPGARRRAERPHREPPPHHHRRRPADRAAGGRHRRRRHPAALRPARGPAPLPQVLKSYRVARKPPLDSLPAVVAAAQEVDRALGEEGRLVLRYSGTEPLVRIMIEGPSREAIDRLEQELAGVLLAELAG